MSDKTTWLTPAAHTKLSEEYEELTTEGRRHIVERIAEARSHGDLRENADYDAAKNEQGMMEARIRQLKHLLENAEVREAVDTGKVEIGSIVTVTNGDLTPRGPRRHLREPRLWRSDGRSRRPPRNSLDGSHRRRFGDVRGARRDVHLHHREHPAV